MPESIAGIETGYKVKTDEDRQKKEAWIAKTRKGYEDAMQEVRAALADSANQNLGQPAIVNDVDFSKFKGFSTEAGGGRQLVSLNPAYFDSKLPKYVPQFMIVYWRWEKNSASGNFKNRLEANFNFNALKEMIDK